MSACISLYKIVDLSKVYIIKIKSKDDSETYNEIIVINQDGFNYITGKISLTKTSDTVNAYVANNTLDDNFWLNTIYEYLQNHNCLYTILNADKYSYDKRSHKYIEDISQFKILHNKYMSNVKEINSTSIIVEKIYYLQGWFFTKKFFNSNRFQYFAYTKNQAINLFKNYISFKSKNYNINDILNIKKHLNILLNMFDNDTILEINW